MMKQNGWMLGGESSGHIVCCDVTTTGDGIISALQVLRALIERGKSLADACSEMKMLPQVMINVPVVNSTDLNAHKKVQDAIGATEAKLAGSGRVLLRPSGTEPVIRVMIEGQDHAMVESLCTELAAVVANAVA